jgi:alkanesulfonate monooxygenase SsuD/methylene tetrahydromethanopterin reductase-like flavin-dependent oxidoreductase (luciferase family)
VHPSIRRGVELPVPTLREAGDGDAVVSGFDAYRAAARAAELAHLDMVWSGPPAPTSTHGAADGTPAVDSCTMAGSLAADTSEIGLGVVATLAGGRMPSVLARDLSSLDVVSGGRAALLIRAVGPWIGAPTDTVPDADVLGALGEAASICRAMFTEPAPTFAGRHYTVDRAVNRPPPRQPGGPPIVMDAGPIDVDGRAVPTAVDAVVAGGEPDDVRQVIARLAAGGSSGSRVPVLWRGVLPEASDEAVAYVAALRAAGADGLICRIEPASAAGVAAIAAALGAEAGDR